MPKAYLTIDDGPSEKFEALIDYLAARKIPAVFFNRGDFMEERPEAVIYGIQKGYVMANHAYSHRRASKLPMEKICEEIVHTEHILDDLYEKAGVQRAGPYFRFPYMDRGMGAWLVEPDKLASKHSHAHHELLLSGLGHAPISPELCKIHKKRELQDFLKGEGFRPLPVRDVSLPWYADTEMAVAIDSLCTFSTSDWALLERHKGKHGFESMEDLKRKIDEDAFLQDAGSNHIILAHEAAEIHEVTVELIDYFCDQGFEFLDLHTGN